MPYVDQVTAAFAMARNRLAQAAKESSATVVFGRLLSRSFEFAVQGVFMAWGYPVKVTKVQRYFDSVLAEHLEAPDADFIRAVWGTEGTQLPELDLGVAVAASSALIDRMEGQRAAPRRQRGRLRRFPRASAGPLSAATISGSLPVSTRAPGRCARGRELSCSARGPAEPGTRTATTTCSSSSLAAQSRTSVPRSWAVCTTWLSSWEWSSTASTFH